MLGAAWWGGMRRRNTNGGKRLFCCAKYAGSVLQREKTQWPCGSNLIPSPVCVPDLRAQQQNKSGISSFKNRYRSIPYHVLFLMRSCAQTCSWLAANPDRILQTCTALGTVHFKITKEGSLEFLLFLTCSVLCAWWNALHSSLSYSKVCGSSSSIF